MVIRIKQIMGKIITLKKIKKIVDSIKNINQSIVLVGGCFDILHVGHIKFLKEAKRHGDYLLVILESDETVRILKGENRPNFPQKDRAEVLSSIKFVDSVVLLNPFGKDEDYNKLILQIKPDIIAVTENDPIMEKKKYQAEMVGGKLVEIPHIKTYSSSELARLIGIE